MYVAHIVLLDRYVSFIAEYEFVANIRPGWCFFLNTKVVYCVYVNFPSASTEIVKFIL